MRKYIQAQQTLPGLIMSLNNVFDVALCFPTFCFLSVQLLYWSHCPASVSCPPTRIVSRLHHQLGNIISNIWLCQCFSLQNVLSQSHFIGSCKDLNIIYIYTDNISTMFFFLICGIILLKSKSNLASQAEELSECYQLPLHNDSSGYSLTSWHRAKKLHMKQTE